VSTTTATVQYIMTNILQKYSNFSFYNTVYSAHNENKIQYPDIDMCIGELLVKGFSSLTSRILAQVSWQSHGFHIVASQQRKIRKNLRRVFNRHVFCSSIGY